MENNNVGTIKVNDKEMSLEEFEILKESVSKSKDMKLVEVSQGVYKTRLYG